MRTLIELYDDRPVENILATEVFRPERTVFLCPSSIGSREKDILRRFFKSRGVQTELVFYETSMYITERLIQTLRKVIKAYPECVIDVTGGTDAALFACGSVCEAQHVPCFTYSRRQGCFYNISGADFADRVRCTVKYSVENCFAMTGGALREGRVNNSILDKYRTLYEPFFDIYERFIDGWASAVSYFQTASQHGKTLLLRVNTPLSFKDSRGKRINAPIELIKALSGIGMLNDVSVADTVSFSFRDEQVRTWLRDVGSVLELYVCHVCTQTKLFNDVCMSAVVDWEGKKRGDSVTNEIDVMAMYGILPVFISCKTCFVTTEALNELAILRDRFGGKSAKAAIVTTRECGSPARHRAAELGICVIDSTDLFNRRIATRLRTLLKND